MPIGQLAFKMIIILIYSMLSLNSLIDKSIYVDIVTNLLCDDQVYLFFHLIFDISNW